MKRLLAISWEMPPMYGPRATQVSRTLGALAPLGWESTVVCLNPRRGGPNWRDGADVALPAGVHAVRVKSPEEWLPTRALWRLMPSLRDRPVPKWPWIHPAATAATHAAAHGLFDGLVSFAQPWSSHLAALRVHRQTKLPWVAHFSDPWADDPFLRLSSSRRAAWLRLEQDVVASAAGVVFVSEETADLVMAKYPAAWRSKVAVVSHGFSRRMSAAGGTTRREGPLRLVHTGRFYDGLRTPLPLLRALAALNAREPLGGALEVTLIGPHTTTYQRDVAALGLTSIVRLGDRVSRAEAESIAEAADVLLLIEAPAAVSSPYLPSKLIDYLPLSKPILGITPADGASATLLRRLGAFVAAPDDEAAMVNALCVLLSRSREGTLQVAPEFARVAAEYDITRTAAAFSDALTRAFAGAASR